MGGGGWRGEQRIVLLGWDGVRLVRRGDRRAGPRVCVAAGCASVEEHTGPTGIRSRLSTTISGAHSLAVCTAATC
jgi:hypothetical protein